MSFGGRDIAKRQTSLLHLKQISDVFRLFIIHMRMKVYIRYIHALGRELGMFPVPRPRHRDATRGLLYGMLRNRTDSKQEALSPEDSWSGQIASIANACQSDF